MFDETEERPSVYDSLKKSSLYREVETTSEASLNHQSLEPGVEGHDVRFVQALADWIIKHRSNLRDNQRPQSPLDRLPTH